MKKIMVTSLKFKEYNGKRAVVIMLTNKSKIVISKDDNGEYNAKCIGKSKLSPIEYLLAEQVCCACVTYLDGGEKETMSMKEMGYANALATERFDWAAAGYAVSEDPNEMCTEMCDHIAHFEDI